MAKLYNLARMTTATTGTGTITLGFAVAGFLSFAGAGIADGETVTYAIKDGSNSEVGRGVYTASGTTLTRNVLRSTNSNAAISLSGSAEVAISAAAEDFDEYTTENLVINPLGQWAQAGVGSTSDGSYSGFDQWYCLTQSNPVTTSQLTDVENGMPFAMRITQANASAQRFGIAQPLESIRVKPLRGQTVTLAARVQMSASTTLRVALVEWTGTADSPTKDVVNDWTSATFTTGNFFISTTTTVAGTGSKALTANTLADITLSAAISSSANNLVLFFWTDSTQAQNVTLDISKVWLAPGSSAPPFKRTRPETDLRFCQRFYETNNYICTFNVSSGVSVYNLIQYMVEKRGTPSIAFSSSSYDGFPGNPTAYPTSKGFRYDNTPNTTKVNAFQSFSWAANARL
jgi:hypothetical protein